MRPPSISACLTAFCLLATTPALADEARDCDVLCRLQGYLSTDHMTGDASGQAAAPPSVKPGRGHAAARKPKVATAAPKAAPAVAAAPTVHRPEPPAQAVVRAPAAAKRTVADVVVPVPARSPGKAAARTPRAATAITAKLPAAEPARPAPAVAALAKPTPVRVARARAPRPTAVPPAAPTHTASLSTLIPGSAPVLQAGFH